MLRIYIKEDDTNFASKLEVVSDVERLFSQLRLKGTDAERRIIKEIEKGEYIDSHSYKDRFGYKLHLSEMSTGCKAALCVINHPDKIIDLIECGNNARDVIISLCELGNILIRDNGITFKKYSDEVTIRVDDYIITSINRLNKYIQDERPLKPDLSIGGISHV